MSIAFEMFMRLRTRVLTVSQRNIVATVNLDCRLDLKTIALHARNAEYNPKVRAHQPSAACDLQLTCLPAFCRRHHAYP